MCIICSNKISVCGFRSMIVFDFRTVTYCISEDTIVVFLQKYDFSFSSNNSPLKLLKIPIYSCHSNPNNTPIFSPNNLCNSKKISKVMTNRRWININKFIGIYTNRSNKKNCLMINRSNRVISLVIYRMKVKVSCSRHPIHIINTWISKR